MSYEGTERRSEHLNYSDLIEKVHRLDTSINSLTILVTEQLKGQMTLIAANQCMTNKHNEFIYGNGNGEKGISIRVDRLEGAEDSHKWTFRAMWGLIGTLFVKIFYDFIRRVH